MDSAGPREGPDVIDLSATCDHAAGHYRVRYDRTELPPSVAVAMAVACVEGEDPGDLEPLAGTVDPDALDALVEGWHPTGAGDVAFTFQGYRVTVRTGGVVTLAPTR